MRCEGIKNPIGQAACYAGGAAKENARGAKGPTSRREERKGLGYEEQRRRLSPDHAPGYEEQQRVLAPKPGGQMIAVSRTTDAELPMLLAKLQEMGIDVVSANGKCEEFVFGRTNVRYGPVMFATVARSILRGSRDSITGRDLEIILTSYFNYVAQSYLVFHDQSLRESHESVGWPPPCKRNEKDSRPGIQALIEVGRNLDWVERVAAVMGVCVTVAVAGNLIGVALLGGDLAMAGASFLQELATHGYNQISDAFSTTVGTGSMQPLQRKYFTSHLLKNNDVLMNFLQTKYSSLGYASRMALHDIVQATY